MTDPEPPTGGARCGHHVVLMGAKPWVRKRRTRGENVMVPGPYYEPLPGEATVVERGMYGVCNRCLAYFGGPYPPIGR